MPTEHRVIPVGTATRQGHRRFHYAELKGRAVDMMNAELVDSEIALHLELTPAGWFNLKRKILRDVSNFETGRIVAAREFMRLERQEVRVLRALDLLDQAAMPPDEKLINMFVALVKTKAELTGAKAAMHLLVEEVDAERADEVMNNRSVTLAEDLTRFYELADRAAQGGIGSGLTAEERDRELEGLQRELVESGRDVTGALAMTGGTDEDGVVHPDEVIDPADMIELPVLGRRGKQQAARDIGRMTDADGMDMRESPGRWIDGEYVTFWHEVVSHGARQELEADPFRNIEEELPGLNSFGDDEL